MTRKQKQNALSRVNAKIQKLEDEKIKIIAEIELLVLEEADNIQIGDVFRFDNKCVTVIKWRDNKYHWEKKTAVTNSFPEEDGMNAITARDLVEDGVKLTSSEALEYKKKFYANKIKKARAKLKECLTMAND